MNTYMDINDSRYGFNSYHHTDRIVDCDHVILIGNESLLDKLQMSVSSICHELDLIRKRRQQDVQDRVFTVIPVVISETIHSALPAEYERYEVIHSSSSNYIQIVKDLLARLYSVSPDFPIFAKAWESYTHLKNQQITNNLRQRQPAQQMIDVETGNIATRFFLGENQANLSQLDFNTWYHPETCHYLLQLVTNQAQCIRVIFPDAGFGDNTQTFKNQLQELIMLSNKINRPAVFISKEPGADNHFVCGIIKNNRLIFINPLGGTSHKMCYQTLAELKNEGTLSAIWLSSNILQQSTYEPHGLVSCGPITTEIAIHIVSTFSPQGMLAVFDQLKIDKPLIHRYSRLIYHEINIDHLLPATLQALQGAPKLI